MINEIRKRLGRGEKVELECIDKNGFLYYEAGHNLEEKKKVLESSLVIDLEKSKWRNYFFIEGSDSFVAGAEIKYFRIKEQENEIEKEPSATFDELIGVAVQAVRDNHLSRYIYYNHADGREIVALYIGEKLTTQWYSGDEMRAVDWIRSLYTETLTIESEDDIERIANGESHVKLSNGNNVPYSELMNLLPSMLFLVLKGATITQKRGR